MKLHTLTLENLIEHSNLAKEVMLTALENDGILKEGEAETLSARYAVIVRQKGMLGKAWDKFRKVEDNCLSYTVLKIVE